jgi:multidrug efflux pump subunit AcrA (membrane-fusion protein)
MSIRHIRISAGLAIGLLAALAFGQTSPPASKPAPDTSQLTQVHRGSLTISLDLHGVFVPVDSFELRITPKQFKDDLIIKQMVKTGQKISKGQNILELETDKIDLQLAAVADELKLAQANLTKAESDATLGEKADELAMNNQKDSLANAQTNLKRWDDTEKDAFLAAQSTIQMMQVNAEVENDTDELNELKKMYKSEDLTNQTADIVLKRANKQLEIALASQKVHKVETDHAVEVDAVIRRQQYVSTFNEQTLALTNLQAAQAQGKVARASALFGAKASATASAKKLDELKSDRSQFTVVTPIDGIAVFGPFEHNSFHQSDPAHFAAGEKVPAEQVLLTVYTPGHLALAVECPESQLLTFPVSAKVSATPASLPQVTYDASLQAHEFVVESDASFDLHADLPAVDERLEPGFKAAVNFDGGKIDNVLLVPASAILHGKVQVCKPGEKIELAVPTTVVIGRTDGTNVEITSGVKEGDWVVTQPKHSGSSDN